MRRREFISLLGGAAAAWPLAARAQPVGTPLVGVLRFDRKEIAEEIFTKPFLRYMKAIGWEQGRNVRFLFAWTEGRNERAQELVGELLAQTPLVVGQRVPLAALALKHRLPGMFPFKENVVAGGLMSYGADPNYLYRRAAAYIDKILKGAKPADLPVEQASKYELVINLKTAKALGLDLPASVLARADEVIE
jgi:hypothetical protein